MAADGAMSTACFIGVDLGTSGCRAQAITSDRRTIASARTPLPPSVRDGSGASEQAPEAWWSAVAAVLRDVSAHTRGHSPVALCVDGTSSTLLLCYPDGAPLGPALMYNDSRSHEQARWIARVAPADSPARGPSSGLAKLLYLKRRLVPRSRTLAIHQADWITGRLTGRFGTSDWNNALKLGYDPQCERWPDWLSWLDLTPVELPRVTAPGTPVAPIDPTVAELLGLPPQTRVMAGTTDSTAAVVAAGAREPGDAVTCLGSTLVVKILSERPVSAPAFGVYSHRFGDFWLIGGASNSGGTVLRQLFGDERIALLSSRLRPDEPTGLDYYPLPSPGERFPINDGRLEPRLTPRPADDSRFFQGVLEGIANVEATAYRRLRSLGAPAPKAVITIGGGATNSGWTRIRERALEVPVRPAAVQEAAYGAALLALTGGAG